MRKGYAWHYRGEKFLASQIGEYVGFVYLITNKETGRSYIGKKNFWSRRSKPPLKGKKRRRRQISPSDWVDYFGSSNELLADVETLGRQKFTRDILHLCKSKGEMSYLEMKEQIINDVLLDPRRWYNNFVGGKIHRIHLIKKASDGGNG